MSKRIYVDTNIIIDFLEGRDLRAYNFVMASYGCRFRWVVSPGVLRELNSHGASVTSLRDLLMSRDKFTIEPLRDSDIVLARTLPTHFADACHAAVALRLGIPVLTQNTKDFLPIRNLEVYTYADIR